MPPKENNFDLIRLLAALQVLFYHAFEHMKLSGYSFIPIVNKYISNFHGVPIFFALSGMLIFWSFDRNQNNVFQYFKNRFLRLYPALWICFIFTFFVLLFFGFINSQNIFSKGILTWIATQISFLQFYTPEALRGFGLRNPNGNLWTICIEIQYYLLVPLLVLLFRNKSFFYKNAVLLSLFVFSLGFNHYIKNLNQEIISTKILGVTLLPYLFFFLSGIIVFINYPYIKKYLEGKFLIAFFIYGIYYTLFLYIYPKYFPGYWPNFMGLIATVLLVYTVFAFAFSYNSLSKRVLRHNDISYGVYIYSGILINIFVHLKLTHSILWFLVFLTTTMLLSILSWKLIEKPALKLK